eukprot:5606289-Pleurochrysis_carterae.AAC.1
MKNAASNYQQNAESSGGAARLLRFVRAAGIAGAFLFLAIYLSRKGGVRLDIATPQREHKAEALLRGDADGARRELFVDEALPASTPPALPPLQSMRPAIPELTLMSLSPPLPSPSPTPDPEGPDPSQSSSPEANLPLPSPLLSPIPSPSTETPLPS